MNIFVILVITFAIFAASRAILRYRSKDITFSELFFWMIIWLSITIITISPQTSGLAAQIAGIGRGADAAFFISIILLFYLLFRVYVKLEHIERDITELVIRLARKDKKD